MLVALKDKTNKSPPLMVKLVMQIIVKFQFCKISYGKFVFRTKQNGAFPLALVHSIMCRFMQLCNTVTNLCNFVTWLQINATL